MSAKPDTPITRKEMYLDVATGGSSTLPEPVTIEEKYLAKIAGMAVDLPAPVPLKHKFLAKIAGMQVDVPTYTAGLPRIYAYLAKAAGQDVDVPQPITREEMYWFDYVGGQPTPSEQEYTGAVPVTFIANGQPLLDYLISGNTVQTGTPTPDNPIQPSECGDKTANLFDKTTLENGIYLAANGNKYGDIKNGVRAGVKIKALPNTAYTLSAQSSANVSTRIFEWGNGTFIKQTPKYNVSGNISLTVTTDAETTEISFNIEGVNAQYATSIMLNTGSTALPYEPYGYKIPISSANTTTPVYLGEVETTRKIKKLVLTGQENWVYESAYTRFKFTLTNMMFLGIRTTPILCSHYITIDDGRALSNIPNNAIYVGGAVGATQILIKTDEYNTESGFKGYLAQQYAAGTPVTVWYVLATPTTGIVNEPLMRIGDYADTVSKEQAGVEIPTVSGSNTLDMLTTVKPSEVYIKYNGEPVPQLSMLSSPSINAPEEPSEEAEETPEEEEEVPEETKNTKPEAVEE